MQPIKNSSSIIGIDVRGEDLRIRFKAGTEYDYHGIPAETIADMLVAESPGKFFAKHIRPKYQGHRVQEEQTNAENQNQAERRVKEGQPEDRKDPGTDAARSTDSD